LQISAFQSEEHFHGFLLQNSGNTLHNSIALCCLSDIYSQTLIQIPSDSLWIAYCCRRHQLAGNLSVTNEPKV